MKQNLKTIILGVVLSVLIQSCSSFNFRGPSEIKEYECCKECEEYCRIDKERGIPRAVQLAVLDYDLKK